ncbi:serine hydrolase domain-containing protein [Acidipropionibacterium acidipropionici]|uniref:serine hydrolase domain-containing protein n=1 Tax=Acidipropionibacterium acidipropionici TaxID=1748 RepID=UPI0022AA6457|nr:serine hydrolase domain-containing protein [Acidipropionibacterium acidipropionici]
MSLVGRAIEARTHRPVDEVIAERILNPLGLSMTRPKASLYPEGTDLAAGYRTVDSGETFTAQPVLDAGALGCIGELYSDVADLATWMHFLGSAFDDFHDPAHEAVLSAATRRRMQTAHTLMLTTDWPFEGKNLDGAGYGYGVIVEADHRFGRIVQHSGGLPGYSSHMCWHPASGVGVVVMANSDSFGTWRVAGDLLRGVLEAAGAPSASVTLWPQTLDAARRLDAAVISGRCIGVEHYRLARNVLRDATTEERHARLERALERTGPILPDPGPLESRILTAEGPASLRWRIPCRDGALIADMRMVGLADPLVQAFSVSVAGPDGRKPIGEGSRASDHHRVAWPED